jgi:hypothetical protein
VARLKIGITVSRGTEFVDQMIWSSGLNQNIIYLVMLLQRLPEVALVTLVDCSGSTTPHPLAEWCGIASMTQQTATDTLDIIIELGSRAEDNCMRSFRDRGGRVVSYMAGNAVVMNFECVASKVAHGETMSTTGYDAVWITPQHWHMNRAWCELTRTPATEMAPHIWEPVCIEAAVRQSKVRYFWQDQDRPNGYRVGTFEPNINVVKTFHIPLLVCEEAYRAKPRLIDRVLLFNTQNLIGYPHFDEFVGSTTLANAGRVFAEGRHMTSNVLGTHIDAVVEHHWENNLNYLYWDVLYSGHPFIHNSTEIEGAGYYYGSFDSQDGGRVLVDALSRHAGRAKQARIDAVDYLWRYRVDNPEVQARHSELLAKVMG